MARWTVEVEGVEETIAKLSIKEALVIEAAEDVDEETAKDLLREVRQTAPVDTGRYRNDWRIEERKGVTYLVNSMWYAIHLVFPNRKFVGSESADVPSKGILHNVRGIVFKYRSTYMQRMIRAIRRVL